MKENPKIMRKSVIIAINVTRSWALLDIIPSHCGVLKANCADHVGI
jgi:hypothetical protein